MPQNKQTVNLWSEERALRRQHLAFLDGLRGIAILLVVVYHYFSDIGIAGYVGVDIFFVISGFIITRKIMTDISAHEFNVFKFYQARIIRLFPAMLAVLLTLIVVGRRRSSMHCHRNAIDRHTLIIQSLDACSEVGSGVRTTRLIDAFNDATLRGRSRI